jgi:Domain of unknown function (DUF2431)
MGKSVKRQRAKKRKLDHSGSSVKAKHQLLLPSPKNGPAAAITTKNRGKVVSSIIQLLGKRSPVLTSYLSEHSNVLIVGDGDFSFGRALVQLRRQYRHENTIPVRLGSLIVTGYDSRTEALRKYGGVGGIEKSLQLIEKEPGATVWHSIDATKSLQEQLQVEGQKSTAAATAVAACNIVVFNFPHSGQQRVHINRNLLYDFFQSVRTLFLAQQQQPPQQPPRMRTGQPPPRQVHVTMKNQRPYIHWGIDDSAKAAGFVPAEEKKNKVHFDMKLWNAYGYRHQTTLGPQEATSLPQLLPNEAEAKLAQTWIFNFIEPEEDQYQPPAEDDDDDDANNEYQRPQLQNHPAMTTVNDAQRRNKETKSPLPAPPPLPPPQCKRTEKDEERHQSMTDDDPGKRTDDDTVTTVVVVVTDEMIDDLVQKRDQARRGQNWPEADRLRTLLISHYGVTLRDHSKQQNTNGASSSWSWTKKKVPNKAKS